MNVELIDTIQSKDAATKYLCKVGTVTTEATYLAYPNKDVVCMPTQTSCKMGCKFCFLTTNGEKLPYRNLFTQEMVDLAKIAKEHIPLSDRPLLYSFMGMGEPLINQMEMIRAMDELKGENVRFAFATMIPKHCHWDFVAAMESIATLGLNVKVHFSLHFTSDVARRAYMPSASDISSSLTLLEAYWRLTKNPVEVHYTMIDGVNDTKDDFENLVELLEPRSLPVKLLYYSENPALSDKPSLNADRWASALKSYGVKAEFYKPNGLDIGASCGQFSLDRY